MKAILRPRRFAADRAAHLPAKTVGGKARRLPLLLVQLTLLVLWAALPAPAHAAPRKIAGWGHGAGKVNGPSGVAVDQSTGDLFVADGGNDRVDKFDSEGHFLLAWGYGVADGKSEVLQVCGPAPESPAKRCFATNFTGPSANNLRPVAVAVDNNHDVYVAEGPQHRVSKFTPDGDFLFMVGKKVDKTTGASICTAAGGDVCGGGLSGTGPGEFSTPEALGFDPAGDLWVTDAGRLERFDSEGNFLSEVPLPAGARSAALAIDPATHDFYVLGPQGHNERQRVHVPEAGTYTLSFEGQTTPSIEGYGAKGVTPGYAEEVEAALAGLSTIGPGNVSVERLGPFGLLVTFIHDLGGRDVPQLGASPPAVVETEQQGAPGSVEKLDPTGAPIETLDSALGDIPEALGGDSAGDLYVGDLGPPYHLLRYDSAGNLVSLFGAGQVVGHPRGNALAVDEGTGVLYTASSASAEAGSTPAAAEVAVQAFAAPEPGPLIEGQRAENVLPTSAALTAVLNLEGHETTYRFEYGTSESYGEETGLKTLPGTGFEEEEVSAEIEKLTPGTEYHFRLVATNHCNEAEPAEECTVYGEDTTFKTRPAVGIEAQWVSALSATAATLRAELDPLGAAAQWWLEYDTSPYGEGEGQHAHGTSVPAPPGALAAGFGAVPVSVPLAGLEPGTTYHYRFVASDVREVKEGGETVKRPFAAYGEDQAFTTQPAASAFSLPDERAWEMVSPPDKHGGRIAAPDGGQGGQVQAAANGEALAYLSYGSLEADPEGNRLIEQSSELARRGPGGAWSTVDITPPHGEVSLYAGGTGLEYKLFSADLTRSLLVQRDATPLSPWASERTPYLRENSQPPAYTPLVVGCPSEGQPCPPAVKEHEDVPPGTEFGKIPSAEGVEIAEGNVRVQAASPDLRHVVLSSSVVPLTESGGSLYEWTAGRLQAIGIKPEGEGAVSGSASVKGGGSRNRISEDGSRVFWAAAGLYVRDLDSEETVRLDVVGPGAFGTGKAEAIFQGANREGTVAFFTDIQNLTEDANEEGADLYRWQADGTDGCEAPGGCLADLTAEVANFGEAAEVQGLLPGIAEDGSRAYFVARGVLDPANVVENGAGPEEAQAGQPNLYEWSEAGGTRFVATLSGEDERDWGWPGNPPLLASNLTAAASPSGRYLAFMSQRPLTGYDNRDASSGQRVQEVFRYDALEEELACVSCNPSGARPVALRPGRPPAGEVSEEFDPQLLWSGVPVAAVLPEATKVSLTGESLYRPRAVQDDGRVFFNAADSLVAADSNGDGDVYEYEPRGAGSCSASAAGAGTALLPGGCVSLISSGTAAGTAAFIDASEGGADIFFYIPARLSVADVDEELDVYDARQHGEPARLDQSAECQGEACQPPASAPELQTPASAAFQGPGNLREAAPKPRCPKGKRRVARHGKARCLKRHSHRKRHQRHRNRRARR